MRTRGELVGRATDDRGSLSAYFIGATLAVVPLVGLVVDGGGQVRATQHADLVADEAARSAGQMVDASDAIKGDRIVLSPRAAEAAREYVQSQGLEVDSVIIEPGAREVTVRTRTTYEPVFLGAIGLGPWTIEGESTASVTQVDLDGEEFRR
ncbi:hypothetical protein AWH69_03985 [Janibacter melonis]|uniref:Putative Flp pilus-assembly TadG-like N-terminal domain-containing protein n=1 Tax=Janibacter melonis TaxID=262209 RepID=A0A176QGL4_9MICO|nr:pilus assembly protein TadG-related protein [Janibacter melonis]MBD5830598.1 pilus assembly protein [Janibacter melonis]OAB88936.1 hypothetical protein AWH69_03985 [Janibacter melonis]